MTPVATRIKLPLPAGVTATRNTASGRKGATRWSTWRGLPADGQWLGDLVRFMPEAVWSWQPATGPAVEGTLDEAAAALAAAATAPANPVPAREYEPGYDAERELQGWMNELRSARRDGR